jgi:hypothetical protein
MTIGVATRDCAVRKSPVSIRAPIAAYLESPQPPLSEAIDVINVNSVTCEQEELLRINRVGKHVAL